MSSATRCRTFGLATKGGDDGTVPIPEPLRPYLDAAIKLSPSRWVFPAADGTQRAADTNLKAVLRRALGRAGIVEGYEHRCRKPTCGHVESADDSSNRRCPMLLLIIAIVELRRDATGSGPPATRNA